MVGGRLAIFPRRRLAPLLCKQVVPREQSFRQPGRPPFVAEGAGLGTDAF